MSAICMQGRIICRALLAILFLAALPSYAIAKEKSLGVFGPWHAYISTEGGQTVCYMVTTKRIKPVVLKKRGTPYVMITHRPIEASTDVVSYGAGMMMESRKPARLANGTKTFELFSVRDTAWARDALTDHKMVAALQTSPTLKLSFYPAKKAAPMIDIFDVAQAPAAYHAIGKACGLSGETPKKAPQHPKSPSKPMAKK